MSNVTVESQIHAWEDAGKTVLSPLRVEIAAVCRGGFDQHGDQRYIVLLHDCTKEIVTGDSCTCGNERAPADMTEPLATGWQKRIARSCLHQKAALQAVNCGGRCDCGELSVEEHEHGTKGVVTMKTYTCANCGERRDDLDDTIL